MPELVAAPPLTPPPRSAADLFGSAASDSRQLWFDADAFHRPDFDPDSFVAALRSSVPLEALAGELRVYLASLQAELVELVNRDYNDFVALGTQLVDVGSAADRMRAPLADLRARVAALRATLDAALSALRSGLRQRADASDAREVLELLLDTAHVVSKVEKLIKELPSTPADFENGEVIALAEKNNAHSLQQMDNGIILRETQSILLERIASEMNRLKFYISRAKDLPFIVNMEDRIQKATTLLNENLTHCFVNGLKHRDANAIYNCLRAYAAIDNTSAAEELFRTTIVSPLVEKVIPRTFSEVASGTSTDLLEEDYQQIMKCIRDDCKFFLDISSSANSGLHVFGFLANSILKEVLHAIDNGKKGAFSPGRPKEFLKNYKSSLGFLAYLEGYCPSRSAVAKFRSAAVYVEFMKKWNVEAYFRSRFQEIAGSLDSALTATKISQNDKSQEQRPKLLLNQSFILLESLRACWNEDVLVLSSSDKFLRLTLQLISRYSTWLASGLEARKQLNPSSNSTTNSDLAVAQVEDFVYVMHDVRSLVSELAGGYLEHVLHILEACAAEVRDLVKESILQAGKALESSLPAIMGTIIEAIVEKSVEDLRQLKGISATYRMTNKLPVRHSPYVSGILRPLKAFLDGEHVAYLTKESKDELVYGTIERITTRYYDLASELVTVARKTESSLIRLRQGAQRRVGARTDAADNNISDTDKICMQLFLDIQEYGRNLVAVGVKAADISDYRALWKLVAADDRQAEIVF